MNDIELDSTERPTVKAIPLHTVQSELYDWGSSIEEIRLHQQETLTNLQGEYETFLANGDEYYAYLTLQEIPVAASLARLIHKPTSYPSCSRIRDIIQQYKEKY